MKNPKRALAVSLLALATAGGPISAQEAINNPFQAISPSAQRAPAVAAVVVPSGDEMGNHIASQVLNMNGYNITNVKDPFFESDAVNLDYFNKNNGWDHKAIGDIDMSGFTLKNMGALDMGGRLILDSALDDAKVVNSTLTNSIITKSTIDNSEMTNIQVDGGTLDAVTINDAVVFGPRLTGGTAKALTLAEPNIEAPMVSGGVITGSELVDVTLDAPILNQPTVNGGVFSQAATVDATHQNSTFQGNTVVEGGMDLTDNRITGAADATDDTDVMNLRSTRALFEELVANIELPDAPAPVVVVEAAPVDPVEAVEVEDLVVTAEPREPISELEIEALKLSLASLYNEGLARVSATEAGAHVAGDLHVEGTLKGVAAMYRPTPQREDALGLLDGGDATSALSGIAGMVYHLPNGNLAMGIDPGTIPAEMSFVMKAGENVDGAKNQSIDYIQMIAPMIAAIQTMDARITSLEAQISSAK